MTLKVKKNKSVKVKSCKWTSKKKAIAVVSRKGVVTGKKAGKATITAAAPTIIPTVVPSTAPTPNPDKSKNGIRKYDDGQMDKTMTAPELMQM